MASPKPSFDCTRARTAVERAICGDAELARLDAAVAAAYRQALDRLRPDRTLAAALRRDQSEFAASREGALERPDGSLARYLQSRRAWLDTVAAPRSGFEGAWINGAGSLTIERRDGGLFGVVAKGDDPIRGSYTCTFNGVGRPGAGELAVSWEKQAAHDEDEAEGWTLRLSRDGAVLRVEQRRNGSEAPTPPFCGVHGTLEGSYIPARLLPDPVRAWRSG
ncbi:MAG TPA: lysozyme inhibitor LprI family protein [Beijerinckiaceae bacterium]